MHQCMGTIHEDGGTADLRLIGIIHSPYLQQGDAPRQGRLSDKESTIEVLPAYTGGLQDVELHPHLIVLYWLDRADRNTLKATPPGTHTEHGVFATRSPDRPNPIGFAVVDLLRRDGNRFVVRGLDALDGTPLLDLKPYSAGIDCVKE
jgi:tRNA-Thr(GGU) m(6)t(6)A37 methyltransferase TsaA